MDDMSRADAAMERYLTTAPGAKEAFHNDVTYHAFATQLRLVLQSVDASLDAEGIGSDIRDRVMQRVVDEALDEDAALRRRGNSLPRRGHQLKLRGHGNNSLAASCIGDEP